MLQNFFKTLTRFAMASTLNIIGLSVAFTAFAIIMMQVKYELSYGKNDPNHEQIFRVEYMSGWEKGKYSTSINTSYVQIYAEREPKVRSYYIESTKETVYVSAENLITATDTVFSTDKHSMHLVANNPCEVFEFNVIGGSFDGLAEPDKVAIPQSIALKLWGKTDVINNVIYIETKNDNQIKGRRNSSVVCCVFEDLPETSIISNGIFKASKIYGKIPTGIENTYIKELYIRANLSDTAVIQANFNRTLKELQQQTPEYYRNTNVEDFRLVPVGQIYYDTLTERFNSIGGNRSLTNLLLSIAMLIIVIAAINFINFSTAIAPRRIKGLNTRLVFGNTIGAIRRMLIFESVGVAIIAFGVSLIWIELLDTTNFIQLLKIKSISVADNAQVILTTGAIAVITGFLAGVYPAYYNTKFKPALVLKGSGEGSISGRWLRTVLISLQYMIAIALISGSIFIWVQTDYLRSRPLGFNKENILVMSVFGLTHNQQMRLEKEVRENPQVTDITFSWSMLGQSESMGTTISDGEHKGETIWEMLVRWDFMDFMQIPLIAGRGFEQDDNPINYEPDSKNIWAIYSGTKHIANEKASKYFKLQVDSSFQNRKVIGVTGDVNTRPLYQETEPILFAASSQFGVMYIKVKNSDTPALIDFVKDKYDNFDCNTVFNIQFMDERLAKMYDKEAQLGKLVTIFSALAIIIALMGVFGLVVFETQYRRREIALRKINGAGAATILGMFNRRFIIIILACFVVATPVAWYFVDDWLKAFPYRTAIHWWVFVAALAIVLIITILTVSMQTWRAATENPVKSLKAE